jgi:hypothetical protein
MRRQVRQGESAGSAIRRCEATLSPEAWGVKGIRHFCFRVKARALLLLAQSRSPATSREAHPARA